MAADGKKIEDSERPFVVWQRLDPSDKLGAAKPATVPSKAKPSSGQSPSPSGIERRVWRGVAPPIPDDILALADSSFEDITPAQMAVRRMAHSPIAPIGMVATVSALVMMIVSMRRRDSLALQRYARYRIAAQGLTICSLVGGAWYYLKKDGFM
ncbi:hypothetical protein niasHS_014197 [Heterodera schachtii]|uniref:HIG1 domain-containing protein n=2 Tax=Heterodera TaxID=34509 RepID=A0ABD2I3F7_HETSC